MSLSIICSNCDKKLKVKDELAGKKVRCPDCSATISIPAKSQPSPEDDEPAPPKRRRRPVEEDEYLPDVEDDEERIPARKRKKKGRQIAWGRILGGGLKAVVRYTLAAFGLLVVMLITIAIAMHLPGVVMGVGLLVYVVGYLWLVIVPFEDGALEGLLCLFLPFYVIYYFIKNFDKMKEPFLISCVGLFLFMVGSCAGGGMKPSPRGQRAFPQWQTESLFRSEVASLSEASHPHVG